MDGMDCTELLWLCFWCQAFSPHHFRMVKCVYFDIFAHFTNLDVAENLKNESNHPNHRASYDLANFINLDEAENLKNKPNYRGLFEIYKKCFISNIKMYTFFHHKNDG